MAQANTSAPIAYGNEEIESVRIQGVTGDYVDFSTFDAERGRMISPIEIERSRPVVILGWEIADRLFGQADPIEKVVRIRGVHFRVVGVSEKKGAIFGNSMDSFAVIPLGAFHKLFGARQSSAGDGQAARPGAGPGGQGRRARRAARAAAARTGRARQLRHRQLRFGARHLQPGDRRHFRGARRHRRAVARRRRHRHHEHHADGGERADARDRACARRSAPSGATSCRRC